MLHGLATFNMYVPGVIDSMGVLAEVQVKAWLVENFKPSLLFGNWELIFVLEPSRHRFP
jgi:hypothetical protein